MSQTVWEPRRAFRDPDDRLLAGVASGVAEHLGFEPTPVRFGFVALTLLGGLGVILYGCLWVMMPVRGSDPADMAAPGLAAATRQGRRSVGRSRVHDVSAALSLTVLGLGAIILLQNAGLWINGRLFWPLLVAGAGIVLLWWRSDETDRNAWIGASGYKAWLRVVLGVVVLGGALWLTLFQAGVSGALGDVIVAILLAALGAALVAGPWLLRLTRDLRAERQERIRSQERADVAAHLHDSVLQTLALIQRQAGDPQMVTQLARTQERELRTWLFDTADPASADLKAALTRAVGEVEAMHQVPIELVVVGDAPADEVVNAIVGAAREAMVNASKHSGAARIDVYAEAGPEQVEIDVRDRGTGFDLDAVTADRQGVRGSIIDRVVRHGGRAEITSKPGEGTEVRLWATRARARAETSEQGDIR
ncbi:MAG TPA: PspC domain-containing protein [Nocardioidaceae bacterium]|nr:PspC domain-containing protein [Nocardioidaceae bacterium]